MSTSGSSEGTVSLQSCWNSKPEGEMNEKCYRVLEKRNRTLPERVQIGEGDTEKEGKPTCGYLLLQKTRSRNGDSWWW